MSEQGKGSLLLPIGIGAGLLLLYFGMKKKETLPPPTPAEPAALLPDVKEGEAAVPQIDPAPAPSYTTAARTTPADATDDNDDEDTAEKADDAEAEDSQSASTTADDDNGGDDENPVPGEASSFIPAQRSSVAPANRQFVPASAPAYTPQNAVNNRVVPVRQTTINKAMRFRQQPAKSSLNARRKVLLSKIRGPLPNTQALLPQPSIAPGVSPGTAIVPAPIINITSSSTPALPPVPQATIFPLKFGITSPYVKEAQRKLGVPATGYFGTMTRSAIQRRFKVNEISEALYKQIITGKAQFPALRKSAANAIHKKKTVPKKLKAFRHK